MGEFLTVFTLMTTPKYRLGHIKCPTYKAAKHKLCLNMFKADFIEV